jgi:uncharacterized protein YbjT (DUF2867 family)
MILVTGASGKTGRAVVRALAERGQRVRALARREISLPGAEQSVVGNLLDEKDVRRAMERVRAAYHLCPNVHPDEIVIGEVVISAAKAAGVEHFVYHSVLHPQAEAMPHHWHKLRVEELLFESGLPFTILQPTAYMQNILAGWKLIVEEGVLRNPYPVETKLSLVDLEDVAEAAATVLAEPGHAGATYELVGTPPLTQTEVAETLSEALGRPLRAESKSIEAWEARARNTGLGDYQRETLIKMFRYYERHGLTGNPNVLRWLLGREPTSLAEFARWAARGPGAEPRRRTPRYCEG